MNILIERGKELEHLFPVKSCQIGAARQYSSLYRPVQRSQELDQRALARAVESHDGDLLARPDRKIHVLDHLFAVMIGKAHVLEFQPQRTLLRQREYVLLHIFLRHELPYQIDLFQFHRQAGNFAEQPVEQRGKARHRREIHCKIRKRQLP